MFNVGDKVRRVSNVDFPYHEMVNGKVYTVSSVDSSGWLNFENGRDYYWEPNGFVLVKSAKESTQQLYTPSELSYIEELENRIQMLEELCSDYVEIIAEKDTEIKDLRNLAYNQI